MFNRSPVRINPASCDGRSSPGWRRLDLIGSRAGRLGIGATIVFGLALASCNKSPTGPGPAGRPSSPGGPPPGSLVRIEVSAPPAIAPGEAVQLTANAVKSDGSVENVSTQAQWSTSTPHLLEISPTGMARGLATGDVFLFARFQNRSAAARTVVVPAGTFRLTGRISEGGVGLENVSLEVLSGVGEGLRTASTTDGRYALYGVGGTVRLHAKKDGYANRIEAIDVTEHSSLDFEVTADRPRLNLAGTYTLTISAAACRFGSSRLPDDVQKRSYTAQIAQDGPRLTVTLRDGDFIVTRGRGDHFDGFVDAAGLVAFTLGANEYYYYYPNDTGQYDLVERYGDTSTVLVSGLVSAQVTSSGISGRLTGGIALMRGQTAPFNSIQANCYGDAHSFDMVRR